MEKDGKIFTQNRYPGAGWKVQALEAGGKPGCLFKQSGIADIFSVTVDGSGSPPEECIFFIDVKIGQVVKGVHLSLSPQSIAL
jgi:hypothetical protein